ncbi:Energy-coupling factor transporter transmembrane protein EcfT [Microbacterium oleivorans]|uniref:energy-coupling factor transporter transmembrane component T n=1 Tax=Microbacterium oleivorans TaxID=273677 RepID=UPI0009779136|nr:energy-coupling factor transporter transmembrane component T [Microbacterium oleivorans]AZS44592.1 Energy-coupling factor transporter transmembrane protein EcfT [Microbacterium oleivorans]
MLTLYRSGTGPWHRMPAGPKTLLLLLLVLGVSLLPASWPAAAIAAAVCLACYVVPGVGFRELGRQVWGLRWLVVVAFGIPCIFLGVEAATVGTVRIVVAVVLAGLLSLTTPVAALLDVVERALRPLRVIGVDATRVALLLVVALGTVPTLTRLAREVRVAQRARGARGIRIFVVPFVVLALRHADDLGDALSARGVR